MKTDTTIYTKDIHIGEIRLQDDGRASIHSLLNGLTGLKPLIKKGKFRNVTIGFSREISWGEPDDMVLEFRGDRPETDYEKKKRENQKLSNLRFYEHKLSEAKAEYEAEQRQKAKKKNAKR